MGLSNCIGPISTEVALALIQSADPPRAAVCDDCVAAPGGGNEFCSAKGWRSVIVAPDAVSIRNSPVAVFPAYFTDASTPGILPLIFTGTRIACGFARKVLGSNTLTFPSS